ncbi:MAG TPA: hypothetical protein PKX28_00790 [Candidatus Hydrogenedentes bacterium]|nr:hypothetical protein [Candidatus Hydrogenedentota bacterium]
MAWWRTVLVVVGLGLGFGGLGWGAEPAVPVKVGRFPQEIAEQWTPDNGLPAKRIDDVRMVNGQLKIRVEDTWYVRDGDQWRASDPETPWYLVPVDADYATLGREKSDHAMDARDVAPESGEPVAVATGKGLFLKQEDGRFRRVVIADEAGRDWAARDVRGVAIAQNGDLWVATPAGVCAGREGSWQFYTGQEGLPYDDFTCAAAASDGSIWFGTTIGAIRWKNGQWRYRQGRRWLPGDHVRAMAPGPDGEMWFATSGGLGRIGWRIMTLAEKAAFYEQEMNLIRRTEYGYVAQAYLERPGDKSEVRLADDDNDGLWTSMYGAGECFAYAATHDPAARERARAAFRALKFLQEVPQMGSIRPPEGYVARTILPGDGPDPNEGRVEQDRRHKEKNDGLWKVYEPRWPRTDDGRWYWKSDTSSDELDGHYFFYPAYFDYVCETEAEKDEVREVVRKLTDHLVEHDFLLIDHDGTPTRWGMYNPKSLNHSPDWWQERGLKSLSMLSYLAVAAHVTGDEKYDKIARELMDRFGYHNNAMFYKVHLGPGSGNQSDDEMAFMCYYNLMKYAKDENLKNQIRCSFFYAWVNEAAEMNPFFNFAYAAFGRGSVYATSFGSFPLEPMVFWLDDAIETLIDFPLDRVNWGHKNSHRKDIIKLPPWISTEPFDSHDGSRGYRVNGKTLPVSERYFNHWNHDPWQLDYSGNGRTLGSGTVFLLPYYMGLLHGFIAVD